MIFAAALREALRYRGFSLLFVSNLVLGLSGFLALEAYKNALLQEVQSKRKEILSGDLAVSARRSLTKEEVNIIRSTVGNGATESLIYDFFAMVKTQKTTRLVLVKAIDDLFPLHGSLVLRNSGSVTQQSPKSSLADNGVWIYTELETQMELQVGDPLKLGNLELKVQDIVTHDPTQTFRSGSFAPRIFIHRSLLPQSGLIQFGSTFTESWIYDLADESSAPRIKEELERKLPDPGIKVDTDETAGEDSGRQLKYLTDFLGLVSLVGLFLSAVGSAYIYRYYLSTRIREIAILRALGLQRNLALAIYLILGTALALLAIPISLFLASLILPALTELLKTLTPFSLDPHIEVYTVLTGTILCIGVSLLVSLPFLLRVRELKPAILFRDGDQDLELKPVHYIAFLPAIFALWGLAAFVANSYRTATIFLLSLMAVIIFLALLGRLTLLLVGKSAKIQRWHTRYALLALSRKPLSSLSIFISLGLGTLLINILPQLQKSLEAEFAVGSQSSLPSLFLFDIQDDQLQEIRNILDAKGFNFVSASPLIRARVLKINGQPYERQLKTGAFITREEENEIRFRNRGVNLSYRDQFSKSERIVSGDPSWGPWDGKGTPALSVEERYASRVGLKIGDMIDFDVQGVEIKGVVRNLRSVSWGSFEPNFFILIQPGVIDEAPKIWIAAVERLSKDDKLTLQRDISAAFANVSIIDVDRVVEDVIELSEQMSWSMQFMSLLSVIVGLVILFSVNKVQIQRSRWEINLLKVQGASKNSISSYAITGGVIVAASAALVGSFLAIVVSWIFSIYFFEGRFSVNLLPPIATSILVCLLSIIVSWLAARAVIKEPAALLLREGE
ncbi:MAG: FtsX-like permease family protein [Bdellovibrionaceae bacterium]|nr:FtsX-like permease family protein [Pseudobdellovibrionaceae bacterium]